MTGASPYGVDGSIVSGDWFVIPGQAQINWPDSAAPAASAPASGKAPRFTSTTGSNEPGGSPGDTLLPFGAGPGLKAAHF